MNVEFKNLKDDEWITTNEEGRMRFVKTDTQTEELGDILNKEDKLELLQKVKNDVLENIERTSRSMRDDKYISIFAFLGLLLATIIVLIVHHGFSALAIPSLGTGLTFFAIVQGVILYKHKNDKKFMKICEKYLQEINEEEPELEQEIEKLKEKYNFREEAKEVNYFEDLSYENREEKRLVRTRTKK